MYAWTSWSSSVKIILKVSVREIQTRSAPSFYTKYFLDVWSKKTEYSLLDEEEETFSLSWVFSLTNCAFLSMHCGTKHSLAIDERRSGERRLKVVSIPESTICGDAISTCFLKYSAVSMLLHIALVKKSGRMNAAQLCLRQHNRNLF